VDEGGLRMFCPDGGFHMFSVFGDLCNNLKFIFIFVIGYALSATDQQRKKDISLVESYHWNHSFGAVFWQFSF
jgi:hypothetical protein